MRLDPPRVAVVSIHHFINLGGAEFVILRATPEDVEAGVQVGDARYPFYPGSAVGLSDPALRVGFFALRHDQDLSTRISAYARDAAGNEATTPSSTSRSSRNSCSRASRSISRSSIASCRRSPRTRRI